MDRPDPTAADDQAWMAVRSNGSLESEDDKMLPGLTRNQRWLACATAAAVIASGFNALIQISKVVIDYYAHHG